MSWDFELLQEPYGAVSEGPVWDGTGLLYTQIQACRIVRFDPSTFELTIVREGTNYANGLALASDGRLFACEGGARRVVCYETDGSTTVLTDQFGGSKFNVPNDLVLDSRGRIWFTDPYYEGAAGPFSFDRRHKELDHDSVYHVEVGGGEAQRLTFDTTRPNGLLLSADESVLYVAQSGRRPDEARQLRGYPVNDDGTLGDHTVLHDFGPNRGVDGMCLDNQGNIVATAGWEHGGPGPSIYVFSPSGEVIARHPVAANRPTNCAFAEDGLNVLYVTSTDGHLFRAETNLQGHPLL